MYDDYTVPSTGRKWVMLIRYPRTVKIDAISQNPEDGIMFIRFSVLRLFHISLTWLLKGGE